MASGLSFEKRLSALKNQLEFKLRIPFYTRTQKYSVKYIVKVSNHSNAVRDYQMLIPVPLNTSYQTILKQPHFNSATVEILRDSVFGNVGALFAGEIEGDGVVKVEQDFEVEVKPRNIVKSEEWIVSNVCKHTEIQNVEQKSGDYEGIEALRVLNQKVVESLVYGDPISGLYKAQDALSREKVDCGGFDSYLVALAQNRGYKARIVSGFWAGYRNNTMHAWLEVQLPDGSVVPLDPSIEQLAKHGRTKKSGKFGFVGSDRIVFSHGCCLSFVINGQKKEVEILQHPLLLPHDPNLRYELEVQVNRL
jgi:Transglutaminase-like superfamily